VREVVVDDELWELIEPLLPRRRRRYRYPGRRRLDDRKVLNGILFVLTTGAAGSTRSSPTAATTPSHTTDAARPWDQTAHHQAQNPTRIRTRP
jgi:transposase